MTHYKQLHTVIARYQEELDWINQLKTPYTIYNKGLSEPNYTCIEIENIGRESHTYLTYILNNYHNLPEYLAFLQGDPFAHCKSTLEVINNFNEHKENTVVWLTDHSATDDRYGYPHHYGLGIGEVSDKIFNKKHYEQFTFSGGAQYIVPASKISNKSYTWWEKVYSVHNTHHQGPWIFERLWPLIWEYEE